MSVKSKTINNLGPEVHLDYAKRTELSEETEIFFRGARGLTESVTFPVIEPVQPSIFDAFFSVPLMAPWAHFPMPLGYATKRKKDFFSHLIVPDLDFEQLEANSDALESLQAMKNKMDEQERQMLLRFLREFMELNNILRRAIAGRHQYQKG
jgi:hypothetical protein